MSKLCLTLLSDDEKFIESFYEIDTNWISEFNELFEKNDIPNKKEIYETELISLLAKSIIDEFVETSEDQQFKVNTLPLENILFKLLFNK